MKSKSSFPEVDLKELLITWEKCFSVELGFVEADTVHIMEVNQWDFAPVFDNTATAQLLGLIPRTRLQELNFNSIPLTADDAAVQRPEIPDKVRMDELLDRMQTTLASIVVSSTMLTEDKPWDYLREPISTGIRFVPRFTLPWLIWNRSSRSSFDVLLMIRGTGWIY